MHEPIYFEDTDFAEDALPPPGWYDSVISSADLRRSAQGNLMLHVVHEVLGAPVAYDRVADYFVLEGPARAVSVARSRLVRLFRACGLDPKGGDAIAPSDLVEARIEVRLEHDQFRGRRRLRVTGCRACAPEASNESPPF